MTLNDYWSRMDNTKVLPGSHQSEDRFVRASYYLKFMGNEAIDPRRQVAGVFSIMRNVSVPWGAADPDHPNIAPTYWRSVLDHTRKNYYFESVLSPYVVMVVSTKSISRRALACAVWRSRAKRASSCKARSTPRSNPRSRSITWPRKIRKH